MGVGFVQLQGALALDLWRLLCTPARPELGVQRRKRHEKTPPAGKSRPKRLQRASCAWFLFT